MSDEGFRRVVRAIRNKRRDSRHRAFVVKLVRGLMQYASSVKVGLRVDATPSEHKAFCLRMKRAARRWLKVMEGKK